MNIKKLILAAIPVLLLAGCVTTDNLRTASEINRMDEELSTLLQNDGQVPEQEARMALASLGIEAMSQAETQAGIGDENAIYNGISYYRIAATALWQGQGAGNQLFAIQQAGGQLCSKLSAEKKPDRDCFYLAIVTLLKAVEMYISDDKFAAADISLANVAEQDNSGLKVQFDQLRDNFKQINDNAITAFSSAINSNQAFISKHDSMKVYMCENFRSVVEVYRTKAKSFAAKMRRYSGAVQVFNFSSDAFIEENPVVISPLSATEFAQSQAEICASVYAG